MKNKINYILLLLIQQLLVVSIGYSQQYTKSYLVDNGRMYIADGHTNLIFTETLIIGDDAVWDIHGTVEIWSKNIYIGQKAKINGTGKIIIHDPAQNLFYDHVLQAPTLLDANGNNNLDILFEVRNSANLILSNLQFNGFTNYSSNDLILHKSINLNNDGVCIELKGNKLQLKESADILNYSSKRMIITGNNYKSQLVKNISANRTFVFPIGISEESYTPAVLSPNTHTDVYASVVDYSTNNIVSEPDYGMDRLWYIYSAESTNMVYSLQHGKITNGNNYVDAEANVYQYAGGNNWIVYNDAYLSEGVHAFENQTSAAADAIKNYFTKRTEKHIGPQAVNDLATVQIDSTVLIPILINDILGTSPLAINELRILKQPKYGTIKILPSGEIQYTPTVEYLAVDEFVYQIMDEKGIVSEATVRVQLLERELFIPNVITPNADDKNDYFVIVGLEKYEKVKLTIVNRWGNEVYKTDNYKNDWRASQLNSGTYYYYLELTDSNKHTSIKKGWVLVKR